MDINKRTAMLIDIQYVRGNRKEKIPDYLYTIWKDTETGRKYVQADPSPKMDIYFEKPEFRDHRYNKSWEYLTKMDKVTVPYSQITNAIIKDIGPSAQAEYSRIISTGDWQAMKRFNLYPYVFGADFDIRAWYRMQWLKDYDNDSVKELKKGFLDIEADGLEVVGLPSPIDCPVDLVTLIDGYTRTSYTFALIGHTNDTEEEEDEGDLVIKEGLEGSELLYEIKDAPKKRMYKPVRTPEVMRMRKERYEQEVALVKDMHGVVDELHATFDELYGDIEYKLYFYRDEKKMLVHLFQLIHQLDLDFIEIWNMSFDIPYLINRMRNLGLDPTVVMCGKEFPVKECYYKEDHKHFQVKLKTDYFHCSCKTVFTDQMRNYAAIRKGQTELRNTKLTYIAKKEIEDEKYNYSEDGNIKTIGYNNYRKYLIYNIKDVLLQYGIESRTEDLDTFYTYAYRNATPYENVFQQTMKLRNVQYMSYMEQGLVPGMNVNQIRNSGIPDPTLFEDSEDEEDDDKKKKGFEGALVGNPILNQAFGMKMYGKKSNSIFNYSIDMDMSRFYPSNIEAMNIVETALHFKIILPAEEFDIRGGKHPYHGITDVQLVKENDDSFKDDVAKELTDNFQTGNYVNTCHKFFNLPSIEDMYKVMKKKVKKYKS